MQKIIIALCVAAGFLLVACESNTGTTTGTSQSNSTGNSPGISPPATSSPSPTPSTIASSGVATCGNPNTTSAASFFPCSMYFNMPVTNATADPNSATLIAALESNGAWGGTPGHPRTFGITGLGGGAGSGIDVYYTNDPVTAPTNMAVSLANLVDDTNDPLLTIPIPKGGSTKGFEDGDTTCTSGGDCHYIVMDTSNHWEVDAYQGTTNTSTNVFTSTGTALWPTTAPTGGWYQTQRGNGCTSADATGLPIGPLLFSVEEIAAGQINHAIRFILNNSEIAHLSYVFPGTHTTSAASATPGSGMPYGAWLRLRSNYPITSLPCGADGCAAQVIAKALQTYGMILADGGNITLTAKSDTYSTLKYANYFSSNLSNDLSALQPSDFTVVEPVGVPTAMPTAIASAFSGYSSGQAANYLEKISTIASNPTQVPNLTCYRNYTYSYLENISVTPPPSATVSEWTSSETGCGSVTNLSEWLGCQIIQGNN